MSRTTPTIWTVLCHVLAGRDMQMTYTDLDGHVWLPSNLASMYQAQLDSWQRDGYLLLMPQGHITPIYADEVEVHLVTFSEDGYSYTTKRLI